MPISLQRYGLSGRRYNIPYFSPGFGLAGLGYEPKKKDPVPPPEEDAPGDPGYIDPPVSPDSPDPGGDVGDIGDVGADGDVPSMPSIPSIPPPVPPPILPIPVIPKPEIPVGGTVTPVDVDDRTMGGNVDVRDVPQDILLGGNVDVRDVPQDPYFGPTKADQRPGLGGVAALPDETVGLTPVEKAVREHGPFSDFMPELGPDVPGTSTGLPAGDTEPGLTGGPGSISDVTSGPSRGADPAGMGPGMGFVGLESIGAPAKGTEFEPAAVSLGMRRGVVDPTQTNITGYNVEDFSTSPPDYAIDKNYGGEYGPAVGGALNLDPTSYRGNLAREAQSKTGNLGTVKSGFGGPVALGLSLLGRGLKAGYNTLTYDGSYAPDVSKGIQDVIGLPGSPGRGFSPLGSKPKTPGLEGGDHGPSGGTTSSGDGSRIGIVDKTGKFEEGTISTGGPESSTPGTIGTAGTSGEGYTTDVDYEKELGPPQTPGTTVGPRESLERKYGPPASPGPGRPAPTPAPPTPSPPAPALTLAQRQAAINPNWNWDEYPEGPSGTFGVDVSDDLSGQPGSPGEFGWGDTETPEPGDEAYW